jgi:hypothetical protein
VAIPVVHCTFELSEDSVVIRGNGTDVADIVAYLDDDNDGIISTFWQLDSDERMAIIDGARIVLRMLVSGDVPPVQIHVEGVGVTMSHTAHDPRYE